MVRTYRWFLSIWFVLLINPIVTRGRVLDYVTWRWSSFVLLSNHPGIDDRSGDGPRRQHFWEVNCPPLTPLSKSKIKKLHKTRFPYYYYPLILHGAPTPRSQPVWRVDSCYPIHLGKGCCAWRKGKEEREENKRENRYIYQIIQAHCRSHHPPLL